MIRVSAKVRGASALAKAFEARSRTAGMRVQIALEQSATIVSQEAQRLVFDPPKTGRVYQKYDPRRTHQASAPGEAPANDLGHLADDITIDRADRARGRIVIASLAHYSKWLEFGTRKMAPRPFLRRALMAMKSAVLDEFRKAMRGR